MRRNWKSCFGLFLLLAGTAMTAGCSLTADEKQDYPEYSAREWYRERWAKLEGGDETVFGELSLGGDKKAQRGGAVGNSSTVNYFLWRATLETLDLGPLESADPFGGVVITDWFTLEEEPDSQYRVTAYILGRELRTDNIKVALYVKSRNGAGVVTKRGSKTAETKLENVILAKARDIRASQYQ